MLEIPGFNNYFLNEKFEVFNKRKNKKLKGSINGAGYIFYHIFDDYGRERNIGKHRLIALATQPLKDGVEKLVVNHKDGNKKNNAPSNLEWVTYRENVLHAGSLNLTSKVKSVQVRNIKTKEVLTFSTMKECGIFFGISSDMVAYYCKQGELKIHKNGLQFRSPATENDWLDLPQINILLLDSAITLRNLETMEEIFFKTFSSCANFLKISPSLLVYYFKNNKQPVFKNKFQMKKTTDVSTWDTPLIKDFRQKVKITDVKTGVEMFYESASSAAKANSLLKTTLNYRLNTNGEKIFSDGKTYKRI